MVTAEINGEVLNFPNEFLFHELGTWIDKEGRMGIAADYVQNCIEIVEVIIEADFYIGREFKAGDELGIVLVNKGEGASDITCPVTGKIIDVNSELEGDSNHTDSLSLGFNKIHNDAVTQDPYGKGWLLKFEVFNKPKDLMTAKAYVEYLKLNN